MLTDLREINKVIPLMEFLEPEISLPSLLLKGWSITVIDLKDCFLVFL